MTELKVLFVGGIAHGDTDAVPLDDNGQLPEQMRVAGAETIRSRGDEDELVLTNVHVAHLYRLQHVPSHDGPVPIYQWESEE